jgi:hypothetical protein
MRTVVGLVALLALLSRPAAGAEPIGVITELHLKDGQVEVKRAAGGEWQAVKPLFAIGAGDQVRATGAARAVLVFVSSQRTTVVTQENSPYVASPPSQPGFGERVKSALTFLQSTPREPRRKSLAVRSPDFPVVIVAPRASEVAADGFSLEWLGPASARHTARIVSADGRVLWEKSDVAGGRQAVAPTDVRLAPGHYRWELESRAYGIQRADFDVATAEAATRVRLAVDAVESARYPAGTAAVLKAAAFMHERFFADARRALLQGVAATPEEPTLHLLLGDVYERIGLDNLAASEYDRAEALSR